jgi:raffinose/stachyose/melibiose transport system substrate-binding protein
MTISGWRSRSNTVSNELRHQANPFAALPGKTKRETAAVVAVMGLATLVAGVLASCSTSAAPASGSQTGTLKVVTWSWKYLPTAVKQFEKAHPGVKVDIEGSVTGQQFFNNEARTLPVSGDDIAVLQAIPGPFDAMENSGELVNLNNIWREDGLAKAYPPSVVKSYTAANGGHYAINVDTFWSPVIWYNKAAFQKAGIPLPGNSISSEQEFLSMAKDLRRAGYVPMAFESDNNAASWAFSVALQSSCGNAGFANLETNWNPKVKVTTSWTSDCVMHALSTIGTYAKDGLWGSDFATETQAEADALFIQGKAAMLASGSYFSTLFPEPGQYHVAFPYGWTTYPAVTGGAPTKMQEFTLDALGVNSKSQHQALAEEFLAFLASKQLNSQQTIQENLPGVEPRSDVALVAGTPSILAQIKDEASKSTGEVPNLTVSVPWEATINSEVLDMLSGQTSAYAVVQDFASLNAQARAQPVSIHGVG